jgi:hypothetical protein
MGSFCDLRISGYSVIEQKYRIDPELLSIFVEADKVHAQRAPDSQGSDEDDEDLAFDGYCNTVAAIAERLDLMGFTPEAARADFDLTLKAELQEKRDLDSVWSDQNRSEEFTPRFVLTTTKRSTSSPGSLLTPGLNPCSGSGRTLLDGGTTMLKPASKSSAGNSTRSKPTFSTSAMTASIHSSATTARIFAF